MSVVSALRDFWTFARVYSRRVLSSILACKIFLFSASSLLFLSFLSAIANCSALAMGSEFRKFLPRNPGTLVWFPHGLFFLLLHYFWRLLFFWFGLLLVYLHFFLAALVGWVCRLFGAGAMLRLLLFWSSKIKVEDCTTRHFLAANVAPSFARWPCFVLWD